MARNKKWPPPDKHLMLTPSGACYLVTHYGSYSRNGPAMGKICQKADGWYYGYAAPGSKRAIYGPKRRKWAAIKAVVRGYESYIGLGPLPR